jgi:metallo-beta-lactamase family protein
MCESGRILHHLKHGISDPKNTILIIGYQAADTLGRKLVESKEKENAVVKIYGEEHFIKAKIFVLDSFSAHADRDELINYFENFKLIKPKEIFLVHGDYDQQTVFKDELNKLGFYKVKIPKRGEEYEI